MRRLAMPPKWSTARFMIGGGIWLALTRVK